MSNVISGAALLAQAAASRSDLASSVPVKEDNLEYDLGNLTAFDYMPFDDELDEESLVARSRDNAQLLMNRIFALPTETMPNDPGLLVALPRPTTKLPRAKPLPEAKPLTKWEEFAQTKGIEKKKRSRMVFDEEKGEYAPRFGYKRANEETEHVIIEEKETPPGQVKKQKTSASDADMTMDPWTRLEQERSERKAKNTKQQNRNLAAAAGNRVSGTIDLTSAAAKKPTKGGHVDLALSVVQSSTASMGKFDDNRYREPTRGTNVPKVKATIEVNDGDRSYEKASQMNVLDRLLKSTGQSDDAALDVTKAMNVTKAQEQTRNRVKKFDAAQKRSTSGKPARGKPSSDNPNAGRGDHRTSRGEGRDGGREGGRGGREGGRGGRGGRGGSSRGGSRGGSSRGGSSRGGSSRGGSSRGSSRGGRGGSSRGSSRG